MPEFKSSSTALGEFPDLSVLHLPHLENEDNDSMGFRVVVRTSELKHKRYFTVAFYYTGGQ